jgi:hypothetical protein
MYCIYRKKKKIHHQKIGTMKPSEVSSLYFLMFHLLKSFSRSELKLVYGKGKNNRGDLFGNY